MIFSKTLSADCDSYHESDDEIPLSMRVVFLWKRWDKMESS